MATSTLTRLDVINKAFDLLGDQPITQAQLGGSAGAEERVNWMLRNYATTRDETLVAHPWNFAVVRVNCSAYVEFTCGVLNPAARTGSCVTFRSDCNVFQALDVGKRLVGDGVQGAATILKFTNCSTVEANITSAFGSVTNIACGSWRLYNWPPPGSNFTYSQIYPADALRLWRLETDEVYAVENLGNDCNTMVIRTNDETIHLRYIRQVTDETIWPAHFVRSLAAHLAAKRAEKSSGQKALSDRLWGLYTASLKDARRIDGQEGTQETLNPRQLIGVRQGRWSSSWGGFGGRTWWP